MKPTVYVYDPTASDELSRVRGIGRYLQILKENFENEFTFTSNILNTKYLPAGRQGEILDTFINPFFNFLKPPLLMTRIAKKQIAVIHDLIPLKYPDHFPAGLKGGLNIFLNKLALKNYDLIITDSEASKKDIVQILNQPPDKIKVIYPCLPKLFYEVQSPKVRKVHKDTLYEILNTKYCLYVGDATWNKNLVNLAKALKIINVQCIFIGKVFEREAKNADFRLMARVAANSRNKQTPTSLLHERKDAFEPTNNPWKKELNQFLELTKDDKRFIFAGYIPDHELIELYRKAKLNILVSRDEGYGFSYFEAASQGCPSVLSNIPVLKETAGDTALFCDPQNPQDIADKINELYSNKELGHKYAEKANKRLELISQIKFKKTFQVLLEH